MHEPCTPPAMEEATPINIGLRQPPIRIEPSRRPWFNAFLRGAPLPPSVRANLAFFSNVATALSLALLALVVVVQFLLWIIR